MARRAGAIRVGGVAGRIHMSGTAVVVAVCAAAGVVAAPSTIGRARDRLASIGVARPESPQGTAWRRRWAMCAVLALVVGGFGIRAALFLAAIGGVVALVVQRVARQRRIAATAVALVEMCRAAAAELRAGQPPGRALVAAGEVLPSSARDVLATAFAAARHGAESELADLLLAAATTPGLAGLSRLGACWRVAANAGAALAPALDRIGDGLQDEIEMTRDIATAMAGPRATFHLLAALPIIGLLLGTAIGANPVAFLLGSPIGLACLVAAFGLDLIGLAWARRIAVRAARLC